MRILVFTSLHPGPGLESHGVFVRERCLRLAAHLGAELCWIQPVPWPRLGRPGGITVRLARLPRRGEGPGYPVLRPRYFHPPGLGARAQAARMAAGAARSFLSRVAAWRPDLVDAHYLWPDGVAALRLSRRAGLPCFVTARGSDVDVLARIPQVARALRRWLPRADRVLAVSPALKEALEALSPGLEVAVAPNGVDPHRFQPGAEAPRRRLVAVGRLVPDKAPALLLDALAAPEGRELPPLEWIGGGPLLGRLRRRALRLGLEDRARFLGALPPAEVARELAQGGVFVHPSRHEGWPNAVMEALCAGLPVAATAVGGLPQLLGKGEHALLVPPQTGPAGWARALSALARRYAEHPLLLRAAARRRGEELAWERSLPAWAELYRAPGPGRPKGRGDG